MSQSLNKEDRRLFINDLYLNTIPLHRRNFATIEQGLNKAIADIYGLEDRMSKLEDDDAQDSSSSNIQHATEEIHSVSVKIPDYMPNRPDLWLIQADAQFSIARITTEETKYYHLLSRLPPSIIEKCADLVVTPHAPGHYEKLRQIIKDRFTPSSSDRITSVLYRSQFVAGTKPSLLFREMLSQAADTIAYDIVLQRFNTIMPDTIRAACTRSINDLTEEYKTTKKRNLIEEGKLLDLADVLAASQFPQTSAIHRGRSSSSRGRGTYRGHQSPQRHNNFSSRGRGRGGSSYHNNNSRGGFQQSSRQYNPNGPFCRIHFKYGHSAEKCADPRNCRFALSNEIETTGSEN